MKKLSCFRKNRWITYILFSFSYIEVISDDIELAYNLNNGNIFELDSNYIISQIKFSKSSDNPFDYLLGIFEASNYKTFSDGLPIAMIKEVELSDTSSNEVNININVPLPYKYIRYKPPNTKSKIITNLKIFGHSYIEGENQDGKILFKVTNLPLMIINTQNSIEPSSLEKYINSNIIIINNNKIDLNQTASIRLRGHSTSYRPKNRIK